MKNKIFTSDTWKVILVILSILVISGIITMVIYQTNPELVSGTTMNISYRNILINRML